MSHVGDEEKVAQDTEVISQAGDDEEVAQDTDAATEQRQVLLEVHVLVNQANKVLVAQEVGTVTDQLEVDSDGHGLACQGSEGLVVQETHILAGHSGGVLEVHASPSCVSVAQGTSEISPKIDLPTSQVTSDVILETYMLTSHVVDVSTEQFEVASRASVSVGRFCVSWEDSDCLRHHVPDQHQGIPAVPLLGGKAALSSSFGGDSASTISSSLFGDGVLVGRMHEMIRSGRSATLGVCDVAEGGVFTLTPLPTSDGVYAISHLARGCVSLWGADGVERLLDPTILFAGLREEILPRLLYVLQYKPSTFARIGLSYLLVHCLNGFGEMLEGLSQLSTQDASVDQLVACNIEYFPSSFASESHVGRGDGDFQETNMDCQVC
ncbi:hypothetical protein HYC85_028076 [Camellia sinensis]|uniref:Uncharacterized protein n=1 Tax=Camellia sinensis TaxID=4442 RepID=A0A7J7FU70_CAMSI|nr:hypothetical protein HYC85_028076 [Camellia sinensis]